MLDFGFGLWHSFRARQSNNETLLNFKKYGDTMKIKCTSPNGKSNMQTIKDSKIVITKFNSFDKMERYINELGFVYKERNAFKEDRSITYRHKNNKKHVFVKSTFDYFTPVSMEMGTVWTVQEF